MYLRKDYMTEVSINEKMNVNNRNHKKYSLPNTQAEADSRNLHISQK